MEYQNFLHSKAVLEDIVKASKIDPTDTILEIGPGLGSLTSELLNTGAKVVCVEKDDRLIPELAEKFKKEIENNQLKIVHGDILEQNIEQLLPEKYKLVANIPYYITGQIIRSFLESKRQPNTITLLVQKEVADRIVARDGKESLLSLSVKAYGEPKYIRTVGKGAFNPPPSIDSAVIFIDKISKDKFAGLDEKFFFDVIHAGFAHKRKQLFSNLSSTTDKDYLLEALEKAGISPKSRAEDISLSAWIEVCKNLTAYN